MDQIKQEKEKANNQGKIMIKMIMEQKKLTDDSKCYDNKLFMFTNKSYINSVCKDYFGLWGYQDCSRKNNFCRMCCEHNIGSNFAQKRFSCKRKCNEQINGKKKKEKKEKKIIKNKKINKKKSIIDEEEI